MKFLVSAQERSGVVESLSSNMTLDSHSEGSDYRVTSQYFDSEGLAFYWEKVDGIRLRRKFRLRFYGDLESGAPRTAFLEIKHRRGELIFKERVRLTPEGAQRVLEDDNELRVLGQHVEASDASRGAPTIAAVESAAEKLSLRATNVISYRREAWVSALDERVRLTFDHEVEVRPPLAYDLSTAEVRTPLTLPTVCVMELKFNHFLPRWIRDVLVEEGIRSRRFSKYAEGVVKLGLV